MMQVVYERYCGLDVHKKIFVACLIVLATNGQRHKEFRTFGTMTRDLLALLDWLREAGCTHVALESTCVYWKPIFNLLEGEMSVLLVNAAHIKAAPGRKTDVKDAEWIAFKNRFKLYFEHLFLNALRMKGFRMKKGYGAIRM